MKPEKFPCTVYHQTDPNYPPLFLKNEREFDRLTSKHMLGTEPIPAPKPVPPVGVAMEQVERLLLQIADLEEQNECLRLELEAAKVKRGGRPKKTVEE